jgi:hypothetical protein
MKLFTILLLCTLAVGCGYGKSTTPTQPGTTPVITGLVPNNVISGSAAFPFEVDGSSFAANGVINFNGVAQTTTFVSAGKVTAMIPAASIMNSGTVPVTVTNPGKPGGPYGGGTAAATSTPMNFTIN